MKYNWSKVDELLRTSVISPTEVSSDLLPKEGDDDQIKLPDKILELSSSAVSPGAVLLVGQGGDVLYENAFGSRSIYPEALEMEVSTVFDVASLTKALITSVLVMKLTERGQLDTEKRLSHVLQTFGTHGKEKITLRNLLNHSAGFPAHIPYYQELEELHQSARTGIRGSRGAAEFIYNDIFRSNLEYETGSKSLYSDVGFLLLGKLIETVFCGQTIDKSATKEIFQPLALSSTGFIDLSALRLKGLETVKDAIAATAYCPWRERMLQGEVHDDNAWVMGGVASHAGLFSNAKDIFKFSNTLLECYHGRSSFISRDIIKNFWQRDTSIPGNTWALGWDTPNAKGSSSGSHFSKNSVGHLAFTGCSLWIDPERELSVLLLTNRVHPSTENVKIKEFRPVIHDLVMETLGFS